MKSTLNNYLDNHKKKHVNLNSNNLYACSI